VHYKCSGITLICHLDQSNKLLDVLKLFTRIFNASFGHFEQRKEIEDHFLRPAAYNLENRPRGKFLIATNSVVTNHLLEVHLLVTKTEAMRTHGHLTLLALEFPSMVRPIRPLDLLPHFPVETIQNPI